MLLEEDPATVGQRATPWPTCERESAEHVLTRRCKIQQLIHHTIHNFNINPDKTAVARVSESLSTLHQARDLRLREAEASLKSALNLTTQTRAQSLCRAG